jgi:hypothetical protein
MFDYILSKPLTEESFSTIKNRLKKIYDHIIKNAKYYDEHDEEKVKKLFRSVDEKIQADNCADCGDFYDYTINDDNFGYKVRIYVYSPDDIDKIKNLFISKEIDEEKTRNILNDIIGTFSYAISSFIECTMVSWYYYRDDCYNPNLSDRDKNFSELFDSEHAITDLIDILFGFEGE